MYIVSKDEGVTEKETSADMRNRFCLDDESVKELAMLTIKTEELYGYPVDLEFGFAENKLYLLQARPITTIAQDQKAADEEREFIMTPRDQKDFLAQYGGQYRRSRQPVIRFTHCAGFGIRPQREHEGLPCDGHRD